MELLSIPAIIAAVEAVKLAGLPSKYASIFSVILGVCFGLGVGNWLAGLLIGLAASGLYSGVKNVIKR